jgi:signal peptide peptidase SppA
MAMLYLHNILNGVWLIDPDYANNYLPLVAAYMRGEIPKSDNTTKERFLSFYNKSADDSFYSDISDVSDVPSGSVGIIDISGAMTKHDQACGPRGMVSKADALRKLYAADNIEGIILKIESGGGEDSAMSVLLEALSERNKGVVAFVDDMACSAAYGIASGCDFIVANSEKARVGSIGTYITISDYTEYWKQQGIRIIDVYASLSKDKNREFHEAIEGNVEPLRKIVDRYCSDFIETVRRNRLGIISDDIKRWSTGKTFFADEALDLGLIDKIDSFQNTLNYFV